MQIAKSDFDKNRDDLSMGLNPMYKINYNHTQGGVV